MAKYSFLLFISMFSVRPVIAQQKPALILKKVYTKLHILKGESPTYTVALKKDIYYTIVVEQQGIDLVVDLADKNGKQLQEMDSPNGKYGPEKIDFSPDSTALFYITVKALTDSANSVAGDYTIEIKEAPKKLSRFTKKQLTEDLEILRNGFLETHVGLWYNTFAAFDSMCNLQKSKIKDNRTGMEFYRLLAPLVAFTKEGHANVKLSEEINGFLKQKGDFFPFFIKTLGNKIYVINDLENYKAKGMLLTKINGIDVDSIMNFFLTIEPADGYNYSSKYRWSETAFGRYYQRFFGAVPYFDVVLTDPVTASVVTYSHIPAVTTKEYNKQRQKLAAAIPAYTFKNAAVFKMDTALSTATITVNTFSTSSYKGGRKGFKDFLENTFSLIKARQIKHLIIDVRKNEGGAQGMEDHLLSYLIDKEYVKYKYVEIPAFSYAFYPYTNYSIPEQQQHFEQDLHEDFYSANDGRNINKPEKYTGDKPASNSFKGDLYILISGLTFSGGSEFAALAKNYTNAIFIGEEAGGGYYGNTSGEFLQFTLPNSKLMGRIPILKFIIEPKENNIPFGHGVIPDYYVQPSIQEYLDGYDAEIEFAKKMITK